MLEFLKHRQTVKNRPNVNESYLGVVHLDDGILQSAEYPVANLFIYAANVNVKNNKKFGSFCSSLFHEK